MINFNFSNCPDTPACYKFWVSNKIIYIGKTKALRTRLNQHKYTLTCPSPKPSDRWRELVTDISYIPCESEADAEIIETIEIVNESPIFNIDKQSKNKITLEITNIPEEIFLVFDISPDADDAYFQFLSPHTAWANTIEKVTELQEYMEKESTELKTTLKETETLLKATYLFLTKHVNNKN